MQEASRFIDLEVALQGDTVEAVIAELTEGLDVTGTVMESVGWSGHPTVRFVGSPAGLAALRARYDGRDE